MAQIKFFGLRESIESKRELLSMAIHNAVVEAFSCPPDKKFHRFFPMEKENFVYPADRSEQYTIIEISIFEGRSVEAKKSLIRLIFENIENDCQIKPHDVEITITETPKLNWGIRGVTGDELALNYKVEV